MAKLDSYRVDCVVIGAGAIGLAVGRALAVGGREVVIVEAQREIGSETSSRNSEVIHAGLYYPEGSLKAHACVQGRRRLYEYLEAHCVPHERCGKLVVATTEDEEAALAALLERATNNGVEELSLIDGQAARALEPALGDGVRLALLSPVSGILDSHAYYLCLQGEFEDAGGMIAFDSPVLAGTVCAEGVRLRTGGPAPCELRARTVVNAAGLHAVSVARHIEGPHQAGLPTARFAKGSYFTAAGSVPFSRLIYPLPGSHGLGVHFTRDLSGRMKFGPDVEWLEEGAGPPFDYDVDPDRAAAFYASIRAYWPGLADGALSPDYAGIRPKLSGPGEPATDFRIDRWEEDRLINLLGMESPGLTASLAIADLVATPTDSGAPSGRSAGDGALAASGE